MEIAEHIDALRREGDLLADAAERAGLDAAVPPCPSWQVRDLLRHTGYIHRWATRHVAECPDHVLDGPSEEEILRGGAPDPELLDWFRAGHARAGRDPDRGRSCPGVATFMPAPSSLAFWARRQAHETAIHRADAESAAGKIPEYPAGVRCRRYRRADHGLRPAAQVSAGGRPGTDGGLLRVVATDTGDAWSVEAHEGRLQPRRGAGGDAPDGAGCTVSGAAVRHLPLPVEPPRCRAGRCHRHGR